MTYATHIISAHHPCSPPVTHSHLILRLEQELTKATLNSPSHPNQKFSPYPRGEKRGRSPSPTRDSPSRRRPNSPSSHNQHNSPTPSGGRRKPSHQKPDRFFPSSAGQATSTFSACTLCLGRHRHNIAICASTTLWDKQTPAYCVRNEINRLVNSKGFVLCSNWQRPNGCTNTTHDSRHECSGCGKSDHGAQKCPRAEKA
jgi:hypothetical protein